MSSTNKKLIKTIRMTDEQAERMSAFCDASGIRESEAIRRLIDKGLMTEGLSLYATPLASFVSEIMQSELDLFRTELEKRNDDLENRLAKVVSKGTTTSQRRKLEICQSSRAPS